MYDEGVGSDRTGEAAGGHRDDASVAESSSVSSSVSPAEPGRAIVEAMLRRLSSLSDDQLVDESVRIAAVVSSAQAELAAVLAEIERRGVHSEWDCPSIERFAGWKCQVTPARAASLGVLGRALDELPSLGAAVVAGDLSADKAIAIAKVATPASEAALVDLARNATVEQTRRICSAWRRYDAESPDGAVDGTEARRLDEEAIGRVIVIHDDDGVELRARFDHVNGALVLSALDAITASVRTERREAAPTRSHAPMTTARPASIDEVPREPLDREQWRAQGLLRAFEIAAGSQPTTTRSGFRAEVVVHVPVDALLDATDVDDRNLATEPTMPSVSAPGRRATETATAATPSVSIDTGTETETGTGTGTGTGADTDTDTDTGTPTIDGTGDPGPTKVLTIPTIEPRGVRLRREMARLLVCDSGLHTVLEDSSGDPLHMGPRTNSISDAMRRAVHARDPHCTWPGCVSMVVQIHHRHHRVAGGHDDVENLVPLCTFHHGVVHRRSIVVGRRPDGTLRFLRTDGTSITSADPFARRSPSVDREVDGRRSAVDLLEDRQRAAGIDVDSPLRGSLWMNDPFDLSDAIAAVADRRDAALQRTIATGSPSG